MKEQDIRFLSWIGGSLISKLEQTKDMMLSRDKWDVNILKNWDEALEERKEQVIRNIENGTEKQLCKLSEDQMNRQIAEELQKERNFDCGIKLAKEKFLW